MWRNSFFLTVRLIAIIHESLTEAGQVKLIRTQVKTLPLFVEQMRTNITQNKHSQKKIYSLYYTIRPITPYSGR